MLPVLLLLSEDYNKVAELNHICRKANRTNRYLGQSRSGTALGFSILPSFLTLLLFNFKKTIVGVKYLLVVLV